MKLRSSFIFFATVCSSASMAVTWDNFPTWDGNVTNGWLGQGQIAAAPVENVLMDYKVEFASAMNGQNVTFSVMDWNGVSPTGTTYFTDTFVANGVQQYTGLNIALTTGTTYAFVFDFMGYTGSSIHFDGSNGAILPGHAMWYDGSAWSQVTAFDQKATITWSAVPEPGTMAVAALGLAALARRRKKS